MLKFNIENFLLFVTLFNVNNSYTGTHSSFIFKVLESFTVTPHKQNLIKCGEVICEEKIETNEAKHFICNGNLRYCGDFPGLIYRLKSKGYTAVIATNFAMEYSPRGITPQKESGKYQTCRISNLNIPTGVYVLCQVFSMDGGESAYIFGHRDSLLSVTGTATIKASEFFHIEMSELMTSKLKLTRTQPQRGGLYETFKVTKQAIINGRLETDGFKANKTEFEGKWMTKSGEVYFKKSFMGLYTSEEFDDVGKLDDATLDSMIAFRDMMSMSVEAEYKGETEHPFEKPNTHNWKWLNLFSRFVSTPAPM